MNGAVMLDRTDAKPDPVPEQGRSGAQPKRDILDIASRGEARRPAPDDQPEPGNQQSPEAKRKPDEDEPDGATDDAKPESEGKGGVLATLRKHPWAIGITALILIAAVVLGVLYYLHARHFESTDDAFIDTRSVSISPLVNGNIVEVPVNDNQIVKAGDLLARIDERDYVASRQQAQAQIEQAQAQIENVTAQITAQQSQIDQSIKQVEEAQAALNFSNDENKRYQDLVKTGAGTVQRAQQAASDLQSKQAALAASRAAQSSAERQIGVLKAQRRSAEGQMGQAQAQKASADANVSRTEIHATLDGRVVRLTAAVGQVAAQGQALMVLVPLDVWVTANFKETQLTDMRVGQPVDIEVDAYGRTFKGHVDSVQAGSGTAFSLLPAENATGNYVKVVQRVPVKLVFDSKPDVELGPGMSVVPTVTVR